jgi:adenine-specific DNA methylase
LRKTMTDFSRLIEHAFPLKETSLDSVHEKNVRHGHISTLHIWPARRPLAACRAALIATLLPDPGTAEGRKELCEKIAGKLVKKIERKKMPNGQTVERVKEETEGGILHWGRETANAETLDWFRQEIRKAYGGRAPKVLDPFAGGGAIPLEAMRLGCDATAVDINPVAWFILKCTLEYPQKLAGQARPLPEFILHNDAFMAEYFTKAKGYSKAETKAAIKRLQELLKKKVKWNQKLNQKDFVFEQQGDPDTNEFQADLAWHVRAWGQWVLDRACRGLSQYYPTYADFEPLAKDKIAYEHQPMRLVPIMEDGRADIRALNAEFTQEYLDDKRNPRWVAKPTVAYLWARTVKCKNCRAMIPLLKTRWLCKKTSKRVLLTMEPNVDRTGVVFGVDTEVPARGGNAAQKREHDKRIGIGTMSRAGTTCPCCGTISTGEDLRLESRSGKLGVSLTAVVIEGANRKEYRSPQAAEKTNADVSQDNVTELFSRIPFGVPNEPIPQGGSREGGGSPFTVHLYGITEWRHLFSPRQLLSLGWFVDSIRSLRLQPDFSMLGVDWVEAVTSYLACGASRLADYNSTVCMWAGSRETIAHTFTRYAIPITWDYCEANPIAGGTGSFSGGVDWVALVAEHALRASENQPMPSVELRDIAHLQESIGPFDAIVTDPPYYDVIPYSDLSDFFYVWIRRILADSSEVFREALSANVAPKWNRDLGEGELIEDASRFDGNRPAARLAYEDGMARGFAGALSVLADSGRMCVVFANKKPGAWETLVSALIRSGFVVDGSWPIVTERSGGVRNFNRASLASSVWLVCKKRPSSARPGWDNNVLEEMRTNISVQLREFWDAGIRGPDFVWAATGPAMEAYSKHPVVRKANEPNATMGVGEFLNHVRRMVVDYIVGQVLSGEQGADLAAADRLDDVTAYYLLHRHDFELDDAPVGACILYATACGLSDAELDKTWNILSHAGGDLSSSASDNDSDSADEPDDEWEPDEDSGGGSKVKLKPWNQRQLKSMGYEAPDGKAVPLIDRIHRVMHLWKDGDVEKVDEYLDQHALRRNELFKRVVQSLIELSTNSERSLLESISNHIGAKGTLKDRGPALPFGDEE